MISLSDERLVQEVLQKKSQAEHALYQRFGPLTYGICRRYAGDRMEAEDWHQVGWIRAFDRLSHWKGKGPLGAWLRTLFVHVCLNGLRQKKFHQKWIQAGVESEALESWTDPQPSGDFLQMEQLTELITRLPEGARLVFNLFAVEGYSHKEIAETLSISEETSRQQLSRARGFLKLRIPESARPQPSAFSKTETSPQP